MKKPTMNLPTALRRIKRLEHDLEIVEAEVTFWRGRSIQWQHRAEAMFVKPSTEGAYIFSFPVSQWRIKPLPSKRKRGKR